VNRGSNGGPALDDDAWRTLEEAQADPDVHKRPSHLQRYCGPGSPAHAIVGLGELGALGRWALLACGHWREIRDWDLMPAMGRKRPTKARCGCCRMQIKPRARDVQAAADLHREELTP